MLDVFLLAVIGLLAIAIKEYSDRIHDRDTAARLAEKVEAEAATVKAKVAEAAGIMDFKIERIHVLVNQQKTDLEAEIVSLKTALAESLARRSGDV